MLHNVLSNFLPICSRSEEVTWQRSPPGPSSPRCRVSASSWSWWRPRAPCRSSRWGSRRTSPLYDPDPRRSAPQLPASNNDDHKHQHKSSNNANLSLLPRLVSDLDELLDLRDGGAREVLHRYHCVLQAESDNVIPWRSCWSVVTMIMMVVWSAMILRVGVCRGDLLRT